jgi:outer membrane immunogenic protein
MKSFVCASAAAVALTCMVDGAFVQAVAADLAVRRPPPPVVRAPPPMPFSWTGLYVGVNGGYGFGTAKFTDLGSTKVKGGLAGGQIGYNLQAGQFVWGLEADGDWSGLRGSDNNLLCNGVPCTTQNQFLSTARGRLGIALDRVMPYVTGGLAVGDIRADAPGFTGVSRTNPGWTGGGGIEYALVPNWSVKAEYLFVDLGKANCTGTCGLPAGTSVGFTENVARAGINYHF